MKAQCPICDTVNEIKYYIKRKTETIILNIILNVKCADCGSIFSMAESTTPANDSTVIHKIKEAQDHANYIG